VEVFIRLIDISRGVARLPIITHLFTEDIKRPALVLVHGLGSAGTIWKSLIPKLTDHFSVIAVDLPGHGIAGLDDGEEVDPKSLAEAIVQEVSQAHNISQMHVAGNSLGGWIALEMGAVAPDKVQSITALAPAGLWHHVPTSKLPPSFFDARLLAKVSQHFMKLAYNLPVLKAIGYKKITHLWRELSFESCRDSVLAMANSKGYLPLWRGLRGRKFESAIPKNVNVSSFGLIILFTKSGIVKKLSPASLITSTSNPNAEISNPSKLPSLIFSNGS
jgi:pimeloyl-ACP methyl ester carboxylesterase